MPGTYQIVITSSGPAGNIEYSESDGRYNFYWEFAGVDCIATISSPSSSCWNGLEFGRKIQILQRIAEYVIANRAQGSRYEIVESDLSIVIK